MLNEKEIGYNKMSFCQDCCLLLSSVFTNDLQTFDRFFLESSREKKLPICKCPAEQRQDGSVKVLYSLEYRIKIIAYSTGGNENDNILSILLGKGAYQVPSS